MSNHGSGFDREFTPDDLAIVNMGYWDPNADEDSEQADSAPVEALPIDDGDELDLIVTARCFLEGASLLFIIDALLVRV